VITTGATAVLVDGFEIIENVLAPSEVSRLLTGLEQHEPSERGRGGIRNLLDVVPEVARLAHSRTIRNLVEPVLGLSAHAVRGTLFDKTPKANWKVPWHQDLSIAVQEKVPVGGFGPWSVKAGVVHVQPPAAILETMLAVRIHIDDCAEENGPVRVVPGSHERGRLSAEQIRTISSTSPSVSCSVRCGGVLLMRPLLLHASSASQSPHHRRVIHIDFASGELPGGLKWFSAEPNSQPGN
jgi:ectoine hydroxylase-related dioxygenase (phytanoyl-CoA dioxygenase family)